MPAAVPVVAGLAAGIALVVLFGLFFSSTLALPAEKSRVSIEVPPDPRVGQALDINVRTSYRTFSCAYPHVAILNANTSEVVWDSGTTLMVCDPGMAREGRQANTSWALGGRYVDSENQDLGTSPVVIKEAGPYTISAEFDGLKTTRTIEVLPQVVDVAIREGSAAQSAGKGYDLGTVRVFLGMNNTVRWTNKDVAPHGIAADKDDPGFYAAATDPQGRPVVLQPNGSFEFTFTRTGEFRYHGEPGPWTKGTVIVMSSRPTASELKTELSEKDAAGIVANDILAKNPDAQITDYPLSKKFPVILYYFAPSKDRLVIDHGENNRILGRCDPATLDCYPEYGKLDLQDESDRLAYAVQVIVKADKSARYGDLAYYLIGANTGRIIYSSDSETNSLEKVGAQSLCSPPGFAGQKNGGGNNAPREPSMLPAGYRCAFKDSLSGNGIFVYWDRDLQSIPYLREDSGESAGVIKVAFHRTEEEEKQGGPQTYQIGVDESNKRGFPARLAYVDGSVAVVDERCDVCGLPTRISYNDPDGYSYYVTSDLPSTTLIPMLRSMR